MDLKPCPMRTSRRHWLEGREWECPGRFPRELEGQIWGGVGQRADSVAGEACSKAWWHRLLGRVTGDSGGQFKGKCAFRQRDVPAA